MYSYSAIYNRDRREERRLFAIAHLGGKCAKCGSVYNLDFDHVDPNTKTAEWFKGRPAHNKNDSPHVHGTARTYHELKCHCDPCKLAKRLYRKKLLTYNDVVDYSGT